MKLTMLTVFANVVLVVSNAAAADDAPRAVNGTGNVTVKQLPTAMRMVLQFKESGKDLATAIKNLKDRRDAAREQLIKFGAKQDSIREGATSVPGEDPQAAMISRRMGGPKKKKKTTTKSVTVTGTVSCEWAFPAGSPDELLMFAQTVKDKVLASDLAGQKEEKKLSAEEQEEMEEMEMMQQQFGGRGEVKVGEPLFVFVAKISPAEQQKARTTAFQKARTQAEQLAVAAGKKLGKLRTLNSVSDGALNGQFAHYRRFQNGNEASLDDPSDDADSEETGQSPTCSKVSFVFGVNASFDLDE